TDLVTTFSVPANRIVVSQNWVGSASVGSSNDARPGPPPLEIPEDGFDLVYVGRLVPVKNLGLLVEIVRALRDVRPSVRAVIVGDGAERVALDRLRTQLDIEEHLRFAGWQRDVRPWLERSRVFCLTSHHEGLPIAALEAMAMGLPVISARYPGADELVRD